MKQVKNVVYVVAHDLGRQTGAYGSPFPTPNFDRFAREGFLFTEAYCTSPCCSPSRGCAMTGQTAHTNGLAGLANPGAEWSLPEGATTLVDDFNAAGYETVHAGLQHERQDKHDNRYQKVLDTPGWAEEAVDAAIGYLKAGGGRDRPFYLNVGTNEVHSGQWQTHKLGRTHSRYEQVYGSLDPDSLELPWFIPDFPVLRREWASFGGCVRFWDQQFGRLLDAIDACGRRDDTLVVVTTDHGAASPRGKGTLYREGVEIALAIRPPDGSRGDCERIVSDPIQNIDLLPTLLDACGIAVRDEVQGRSFWPLLAGDTYEPHRQIFIERNFHDDFDPMRCVRTPDHVLIENFDPSKTRQWLPEEVKNLRPDYERWFNELWPEPTEPRPRLELFDRRSDPQERINCADDPAYTAVRDELRARLRRWMEETRDPLLDTTDAEAFKAILAERAPGDTQRSG